MFIYYNDAGTEIKFKMRKHLRIEANIRFVKPFLFLLALQFKRVPIR